MVHENDNPEHVHEQIAECAALLTEVIRALVDYPDGVHIGVVTGSQAVIFEVSVEPDDIRRVIGRKGRTADAVRELLVDLGARIGRRYLLEIVEPSNRVVPPPKGPKL